ncbi:MAG TPA: sigma-70 family RNA polymerase sigma factor [Acidimicrobiales bacterium]|nr:sigma-70 family RNA polymerase sigma factor [Acidimicrobiales bacterium]
MGEFIFHVLVGDSAHDRIEAAASACPPDRYLVEASDAELAAALCRRDVEALEEVFRRHATLVAHTVRRSASAYWVDDMVQTVFLALWQAPERYLPGRGSLASYLVMVTRSKTIDALRSHRSSQERDNRTLPRHSEDVEVQVLAAASVAQLKAALQLLPMTERVAIELAFFGGDSYREVAAKLGDPQGTTKSRIRAGLRHLEALLQGIGVEGYE